MTIDLKSLRYFVTVAEARSVGKAAQRLHMAQPPLSVQIRNLETQLGTPLFVREASGMRLTEAGSALFARAREAIALAHDGVEAARAVGAGRRGRLAVGYMFSLGYAFLPKLVPLLRRTLPEVELQFVEMSAATCEAQILEHHVSVGLCMPPLTRPDVISTPVGTQPLRVAMRADAPLARLSSIPVERLQGQRMVALPKLAREGDSSVAGVMLRRRQITMQVVERVETVHAALALVLAGEGYSFLPACAAVGRPPGVVFRKLKDVTEAYDIAVCRRRDLDSPLVDPFLAAARHALR